MTDNEEFPMPSHVRPSDLFLSAVETSPGFIQIFQPEDSKMVFWHYDQIVNSYRDQVNQIREQGMLIDPRRGSFMVYAIDYLYRMSQVMAKQDVAMLLVMLGQASVEIEQKSMSLSILPREMGDMLLPMGSPFSEAGFNFNELIQHIMSITTTVMMNRENAGRITHDDDLIEQMCRVLVMRLDPKPIPPADALRIAYTMGKVVAEINAGRNIKLLQAFLN